VQVRASAFVPCNPHAKGASWFVFGDGHGLERGGDLLELGGEEAKISMVRR